ncbi:TetR/AcrR family transcriptional regulator C-terminal domain-containing protein [Sphaerisporangium corydalis]|uniref:TetR/AcrR family transcriptional regulator C-terminal domain-containing protein n=1 Tax=Sphaerisporangium corydalis TaxID=1441875 RepID=A0ABV9ES44_9ACTN|nr:TetR/AcrR family transcriptional regulator C-terminal domain-containing protein [Sphaerisporangium corydalis]
MSTHNGRPALTRRTVIEAALRLLDETGLDGLTVRRLAADLGVQSPALYWHFRTKQELLDGMADVIVLDAGMGPPADGESWQDWLARRTRAYRASLSSHRDGARVVTNARDLSPATLQKLDEELSAMVRCGFSPALALRTIAALSQYTNGFVLAEQSHSPTTPPPPTDPAADQLAALAGLLAEGMSATLITALRESGGAGGDEAFEHGLRTFIDGTATALTLQNTPTK